MDALGDLDELNSLIGLVKSKIVRENIRNILHDTQEALFIIQANVAISKFGGKYPAPKLNNLKIKEIEKIIDALEKKIKPERGFIVAGETENSAWLDYARAVSRRAERSVLKYQSQKKRKLDANIIIYLNRLSSLLFAIARSDAKNSKTKEPHPTYK